ncbi:FAD-binding oxidoreductase [Aquabacterium sp.]|uniref:FAD-binding oxidoreductase n=1 Tax=Aquabacterium sp. TaxID=1872578 RepID=UPI0037851EF3
MWRRTAKQRERLQRISGWAGVIEGFGTPFTAKQLGDFQNGLQGEVVVLSDNSYAAARQLQNLAFQHFPLLIVYCEVISDVYQSLAFAHQHKLWITTRSGGHNTAGWSANDGMVIDVSRLDSIVVDPDRRTVTCGPGTDWAKLNATLADYQLHVPTGICGSVCVAGFMQGGGYGQTSRKWGMNSDNVLELLVMLADGRIVRATPEVNADLFWAMRGGTGNNFGVLLQCIYQLHPMPATLWGWGLQWSMKEAPQALYEMQKGYMRHGAPDELGYMAALTFLGDPAEPCLVMRGIWWGDEKQGRKVLEPLMKATGLKKLALNKTGTYDELNEWLWTGVPNCPDLAREDKQSTIIAKQLKVSDWQKVCRRFAESPNPWSCVAIEAYGGAINRVPRDATAWIHRDADMDLFVDVFWMNEQEHREIEAYLDDFMVLLEPYGSGEAYQNYPRAAQKNYRELYWAEQFPKLLAIKRKYDPGNFFHYEQSVKPKPGEKWPKPAPGPIVYEPYGPPPIKP